MKRTAATIVREYGPFPDVTHVHGVSYDGTNIWIATGDTLNAIDPASGKTVRALDVPAHAGTAFDGRHLYQISGDRIQKVDPETGRVVATIPTPDGGASGMAWAEGTSGSGSIANARSIRSIRRPARSFAPSSRTVSSPASPGSMANSGTARGNPTKANCAESTRRAARCWSRSTCRPAWRCRASSSTAATRSSAAAEAAGK